MVHTLLGPTPNLREYTGTFRYHYASNMQAREHSNFSTLIKAFTSYLTMITELVDAVLVSVSGATGLLMGPALLVFGSDSDVPVFLSKTYCSKKI